MADRASAFEIRAFPARRADAQQAKDIDGLMSCYAPDAVYYDVVPPLRFAGTAAIRGSFLRWFDGYAGPVGLETHDLPLAAGDDTAFAPCSIWTRGSAGAGTRGRSGCGRASASGGRAGVADHARARLDPDRPGDHADLAPVRQGPAGLIAVRRLPDRPPIPLRPLSGPRPTAQAAVTNSGPGPATGSVASAHSTSRRRYSAVRSSLRGSSISSRILALIQGAAGVRRDGSWGVDMPSLYGGPLTAVSGRGPRARRYGLRSVTRAGAERPSGTARHATFE